MSQLLERPRHRRAFAHADILAQMGETVCLTPDFHPPVRLGIAAARVMIQPSPPSPCILEDEEFERWDGLG